MSEETNISWTDHTFNPWTGCFPVSPGCAHCYMFALLKRFGRNGKERRKTSPATWRNPVKWNREANPISVNFDQRTRVFPSLCDWLDDEVPIEWLADFLKLIHDTPNLDWLLLTKRPENWRTRMDAAFVYIECEMQSSFERDDLEEWLDSWMDCINMPGRGVYPDNVWIGVSVEDQKRADERIPLLLQIPAKVRFLSVEPLIEAVDLNWIPNSPNVRLRGSAIRRDQISQHVPRIDWVIVGGESGANRRDCGVESICDVARQCVAAGVPVHVKQDCAFKPGQKGRIPDDIWALKQFPK